MTESFRTSHWSTAVTAFFSKLVVGKDNAEAEGMDGQFKCLFPMATKYLTGLYAEEDHTETIPRNCCHLSVRRIRYEARPIARRWILVHAAPRIWSFGQPSLKSFQSKATCFILGAVSDRELYQRLNSTTSTTSNR